MAGCQPKREKEKREDKGRKGRREGGWQDGDSLGSQWGICDFSFSAQSGTQTTRAGGMAQLIIMCCSYQGTLGAWAVERHGRPHDALGRRPWPHALTARLVPIVRGTNRPRCQQPAECRLGKVPTLALVMDGWMAVGAEHSVESATSNSHPSHAWQPETRLVGSARSLDQSWTHLGEPQHLPGHGLYVRLPLTIAVKC